MAKYHLDPPLVPRNGRMLRVIGITRNSTLTGTRLIAINDGVDTCKDWRAEDVEAL